ncbi:hypothetical protein RS84_00673 [Microbacterium hydrocarbonoxydans]|uniref:Uncharacterized protein n=1 Tax=Microbacterium hydrocarbonoxydans TaxID=273678 RepID=A0A0M2HX72_9MICO|nr:hypothetical protein RS84_00673 [Microbacterium hydrocarbonoxydans]
MRAKGLDERSWGLSIPLLRAVSAPIVAVTELRHATS